MEKNNYKKIVQHYEECFKKYGDCAKGVDWPNESELLVRYGVMLDILKYNNEDMEKKVSLLDFGCGTGGLYEYIKSNKMNLTYSGLDISDVFVDNCKKKYTDVPFIKLDILLNEKLLGHYDYIIMNGVFTEKRELTYEEMLQYFCTSVRIIYNHCNKGIAFNVMSKDVDWEREDLFHLPLDVLSSFLTKEITRDFIIRYDYGLYEYTVYIKKKQ